MILATVRISASPSELTAHGSVDPESVIQKDFSASQLPTFVHRLTARKAAVFKRFLDQAKRSMRFKVAVFVLAISALLCPQDAGSLHGEARAALLRRV